MSPPDGRHARVPRPPGSSRYLWFVGVALFLFIAYATLNTLTTRHASSTGVPPAVTSSGPRTRNSSTYLF